MSRPDDYSEFCMSFGFVMGALHRGEIKEWLKECGASEEDLTALKDLLIKISPAFYK